MTQNFFSKKRKMVPMLWPPNAPDLNPIENIWSILKQALWKRRLEIRNAEVTLKITQNYGTN